MRPVFALALMVAADAGLAAAPGSKAPRGPSLGGEWESESMVIDGRPAPGFGSMFMEFTADGKVFMTSRGRAGDLDRLRQSDAWKAIKWRDSGEGFSYDISEAEVWRYIQAQAEAIPAK